jgi:hypothetical protein
MINDGLRKRWGKKATVGVVRWDVWPGKKECLDLTHDLLNPNQRRVLTVTLRHVEKNLRRILTDLVNEEQGILYRTTISLPEDKRPLVRQLVEAALEQIAGLAQRFELPPEIIDHTDALRGSLALLRSDLYDVHARKLRRSGEVDPDLEAELDPAVDNLIELLREISNVAQT